MEGYRWAEICRSKTSPFNYAKWSAIDVYILLSLQSYCFNIANLIYGIIACILATMPLCTDRGGGYWCLSTQSFSQGSQTRPGLQPPFAAITPPGGEHYYPNRRKSVSSLGRKLLTFRMETSSRKSRPILCVLNAFCGFLLCRLLCVLGRTMSAVPAPLAIAEASTRRQLWNIRWKYGWKHEENPWMMCNVYMTCRQLLEKNVVFFAVLCFQDFE